MPSLRQPSSEPSRSGVVRAIDSQLSTAQAGVDAAPHEQCRIASPKRSLTGRHVATTILLFATWLTNGHSAYANASGENDSVYLVGAARHDITPSYPVRLNGFGFRRTESEGVTQPIWAKALAIGSDEAGPLVLITLDSLGVRETHVNEAAQRLSKRYGVRRARLAVAFSHSHTTPKVSGACDTIFSSPIPVEHQARIDRYTSDLIDGMTAVAAAALEDRRPARLSWATGRVGFAKNRRPQGGPVDHGLPVLFVKSLEDDALRAVYATYACHCVTLSNNKISGDWAGFAQREIESRHPGAIAMLSIGCGSDANPASGVTKDNTAAAADQGAQIADEVERLLASDALPIRGNIRAATSHVALPLQPHPNRDDFEKLAIVQSPAGYNAAYQLAKLERGETLADRIDYPIQTWEFGESLAMVFLGGEVCCDYAIELRKRFDASRLWLTAYANDFCAYIPSERLLREGGYGGGAETVYFALPAPLAPGLEALILGMVEQLTSPSFRAADADGATHDPTSSNSTREAPPQPWPLDLATASIEVHPDLKLELVASEPLIADPVAIDFATDGNLWVAEMPDYSKFADEEFEPHGCIKLLRDNNGDGRYDIATVFVDRLRFPTDVKAWRDGVLVCDAPDVLFFRDANGDGVADERRVLLTGFATQNAQARVNSLRWGLDNWIYGSCGLLGGTIRSATGRTIALGQRDFRFRPESGEIEAVSGRSQQGRVRNEWGDWFGCENESLLDHYPLVDAYLARNPHLAPPPPERATPTAQATQLHPLAEPTLFKLSGPPGRPTSVCGLEIYRDDLLGARYAHNAFVAEPVNQLVHRLILSPDGASFTSNVGDEDREVEFLASRDPWFRPVQVRTGPDGAIYVVDMHRAVIEHQKFIPAESLATIDVMAGGRLGRIYRVAPRSVPLRKCRDLAQLSEPELLAEFDGPNGVRRDQIHELIVQRRQTSLAPSLKRLARQSDSPAVRVQALAALDGLNCLDADVLISAVSDSAAEVRRIAIRLSDDWSASSPELGTAILRCVDDSDAQVQLQLACSLGNWRGSNAATALAKLAVSNPDDPYVLAGVWSSLSADNLDEVVRAL
ncbi:MAG: neutral/alkaline non-lysosomal ceramidase N-terminal domain-containing protein, partial [Planctomycetales bacterium]|nr:neutral/alkaline non-lysosomal ceramidase N-terminal domain-containing protein [Planctomycetales bacterium]